jgi:hypothetical protein
MTNTSTLPANTNTQEIEPDRWIPFLAEFTRENRGAHARLEVLAPEAGYLVETENRPFDGVAADVRDGENAVWITFGSTPADHLTHGIRRVTAIRMVPAAGNTGVVLAVDSEDGTRTILELTSPDVYALPPGSPETQSS